MTTEKIFGQPNFLEVAKVMTQLSEQVTSRKCIEDGDEFEINGQKFSLSIQTQTKGVQTKANSLSLCSRTIPEFAFVM